MAFSYDGKIGNEYSTMNNPWGIMNQYSYNGLIEFLNVNNIDSTRKTVSIQDVGLFLSKKKEQLESIKARIDELQRRNNIMYDLASKIEIDNLWTVYNGTGEGLEGLHNAIQIAVRNKYFADCRKRRVEPNGNIPIDYKVTVSSFIKAYAEIQVRRNMSVYDKGFTSRVNETYKQLISLVGTNTRTGIASNKYVD